MTEMQKMIDHLKRQKDENEVFEGLEAASKVGVSSRVDAMASFLLDHLAKETDQSRSRLVGDLVTASVWDLAEGFGLTVDQVQEMFLEHRFGKKEAE
jgi:hypothetical protein